MEQWEMVALIRQGVPEAGGRWADFGAGSGNFTFALAHLLGPEGKIWAIDRSRSALSTLEARLSGSTGAMIYPVPADFAHPPDLPLLDGILMANSLHFQPDPAAILRRLVACLRPGGRFLLVEYDVTGTRSYIPNPIPWEHFRALAPRVGLQEPERVGSRRSPSSGITMYAAAARAPG